MEVESNNIHGNTLVTWRLVCDYITQHGGVTQVPLTKEFLTCIAAAKTRFRVHAEQDRKKREAEAQGLKRRAVDDHLEDLRKKRRILLEVSKSLTRDADRLAEEAKGKAGSKMAELISRSNVLRRGYKETLAELTVIENEIAAKGAELRS